MQHKSLRPTYLLITLSNHFTFSLVSGSRSNVILSRNHLNSLPQRPSMFSRRCSLYISAHLSSHLRFCPRRPPQLSVVIEKFSAWWIRLFLSILGRRFSISEDFPFFRFTTGETESKRYSKIENRNLEWGREILIFDINYTCSIISVFIEYVQGDSIIIDKDFFSNRLR